MLKLFYAVGSCALASHIALEEAGAEYEAVRLDFAAGDQRKPEYLKVNPKGRVPALITDSVSIMLSSCRHVNASGESRGRPPRPRRNRRQCRQRLRRSAPGART